VITEFLLLPSAQSFSFWKNSIKPSITVLGLQLAFVYVFYPYEVSLKAFSFWKFSNTSGAWSKTFSLSFFFPLAPNCDSIMFKCQVM
jgi:hypothetical protein